MRNATTKETIVIEGTSIFTFDAHNGVCASQAYPLGAPSRELTETEKAQLAPSWWSVAAGGPARRSRADLSGLTASEKDKFLLRLDRVAKGMGYPRGMSHFLNL